MKVTVIGAGNIGTLMAAEIAHRGHTVTLYTSKPERISRVIEVYSSEDKLVLTGNISSVTSNLETAVKGAEIIFVTMPAQLFPKLATDMQKFVAAGQKIGIVPGSGGAEFAFSQCIKKGAILFGLQRVHSIARLKEYGKSVYMLGRKSSLSLAAIPSTEAKNIAPIVQDFFDIPTSVEKSYLVITLTPSNPILHTARLYAMFKDYKEGVVYPKNFLFYEEWTPFSSQMLIECDRELQNLCGAIPLELDGVVSLCEYYESDTVEKMTAKISGIKAFVGITSPMKEKDGGFVPDFDSRYFKTDFPYGLKIIKDLAQKFGVDTPNIDKIWNWYVNLVPGGEIPSYISPLTKEQLVSLYR